MITTKKINLFSDKEIIRSNAVGCIVAGIIVFIPVTMLHVLLPDKISLNLYVILVCVICIVCCILYTLFTFLEIDISNIKNKKLTMLLIFGPPVIAICLLLPFIIMNFNAVLEDIYVEKQIEEQLIEEAPATYGLEDTGYTMRQDTPGFLKKMVYDNNGNYLEVFLLKNDSDEYLVYIYSDGTYSQLKETE